MRKRSDEDCSVDMHYISLLYDKFILVFATFYQLGEPKIYKEKNVKIILYEPQKCLRFDKNQSRHLHFSTLKVDYPGGAYILYIVKLIKQNLNLFQVDKNINQPFTKPNIIQLQPTI